jgi:Family of unknown function (DUF6261)
MIKKISLKQLVSTELYQFFSLILGIVDATNPTVSKIKPQRDALNDFLQKLQAAINKEKAFALTKVLEALDTRRDDAISGLMMWITGLTKHPKAVTKEAAKIVKAYLDTHGNSIASQNYQTESAILAKIVADYNSNTPWKTALEGLGGKDWIDEIDAANTAFNTTYQQRTSDMGVATNAESFYTLRTPAVTAYLALVDIVETRYKTAVADGADTTVLKKCIDDMNATITQYQQLIEATKAAKKEVDKK